VSFGQKLNKDYIMATRIIITLSAMALCATGFGSAVQAETMDQTDAPFTKLVPYSDLNLATNEGQKTLTLRIKSAVRTVCGDANGRELKAFQQRMQCEAEAMRLARIQKSDAIAQYRNGQRVAVTNRVIVGN
jgi:UrcA family protein